MSTTNDANADQITNLYQALLGRAPDQSGLQFWDDTGLSTQAIQAEFLRSPEYRTKSIDDLYGNVLGREPDAGGLNYWDQTGLDTSQIQSEMLKSPEYKSSVQGLYSNVFGRQPDSAGLNYWQNSGLGVPQIKQEFLQSPEYSTGIANMYRSVLGRQPDASGQMFWQTSGMGLPDMAQQFMNSPEYIKDSGYASNLIASLRAKDTGPASNNPGVKLLNNPQNSTLTLNFNKPVPTGLSNRPQKFAPPPPAPDIPPPPPTPTPTGGGGSTGGRIVQDANASQISDLYREIFSREPDAGGLEYWDNTGLGVDDIRDSFLNSPEKIGDANADEITGLYREVFGREPDAGGLQYWDQTGLSGAAIRDAFLNSEEKKASATLIPRDNLVGDERTIEFDQGVNDDPLADVINDAVARDDARSVVDDADADAITALYREILGRDPDEGGLRFWDQTGLGSNAIRDAFMNSEEKRGSATLTPKENLTGDQRTIEFDQGASDDPLADVINDAIARDDASNVQTGTNDVPFVDTFDDPLDADANQITALYREILGRDPDEGGLSYWDQTGLGVDDIANSFRASQEYSDLMGLNSIQDDQDALDTLIDLAVAADNAANAGAAEDDSIGIDLGQADNLGGMFEMYDPLEDYATIIFGGAPAGGGGGKSIDDLLVEMLNN